MTVWLLFGQIKAKARKWEWVQLQRWRSCVMMTGQSSPRNIWDHWEPISLEILRPDNLDETLHPHPIPFWLLSKLSPPGYDPLHWDPRIKGWHPWYIHHSTYTVPVGPWGVGRKFLCIPFLQGSGLLRWRLLFEEVSLELLGLGANPLPMLRQLANRFLLPPHFCFATISRPFAFTQDFCPFYRENQSHG